MNELSCYKGEFFDPGKYYTVAEKSYIIHILVVFLFYPHLNFLPYF
jgi:hypothetical protein